MFFCPVLSVQHLMWCLQEWILSVSNRSSFCHLINSGLPTIVVVLFSAVWSLAWCSPATDGFCVLALMRNCVSSQAVCFLQHVDSSELRKKLVYECCFTSFVTSPFGICLFDWQLKLVSCVGSCFLLIDVVDALVLVLNTKALTVDVYFL